VHATYFYLNEAELQLLEKYGQKF